MTREEKSIIIDELTEKFNENNYFYFTDASGLDVAATNNLRRMCFKQGVDYKVAKNTLIEKALQNCDGDFSGLTGEALRGFTGIMFVKETGNVPAKLIKEFRKKQDSTKPAFKGASIDSDVFLGEDQLDMLSSLKSKEELVGEVITLLQSPARNVLGALQSGPHTLGGLIKALQDRGEAAA